MRNETTTAQIEELENGTDATRTAYINQVKETMETYAKIAFPFGLTETTRDHVYSDLYECNPDWQSVSYDNIYQAKALLTALSHPAFKEIPGVNLYESAKMLSRLIRFEEDMHSGAWTALEMDQTFLEYAHSNAGFLPGLQAEYSEKIEVEKFKKSLKKTAA